MELRSRGGLLTYMIADRGLLAASVAIDPGPFGGVLPLPLSALKSAGPVLRNPLYKGRAITLTFDQFKYGWANALDDEEAPHLYDTHHVAGPGVALVQLPTQTSTPSPRPRSISGSRPWPAADHRGREGPHRPMGDRQRRLQLPEAQRASHRYRQVSNRGHSLTIDSGWREVAQTALDFVKRFV